MTMTSAGTNTGTGGTDAGRAGAIRLPQNSARTGGPVRPRTRSWGLVAAAALLVLLTGLGGALLISQASNTDSVLSVAGPVSKGQVIERDDLVQTSVSGVRGAIPVSSIDTVVGKTAVVDLVDGQVLTSAMFAADPLPGPGRAVAGLALEPARVPSAGLQPGDQVQVIAVPAADAGAAVDDAALDSPVVLADKAEVYAIDGSGAAGGQVLLTLIVDEGDAARLAAYSTQNRVAVIETAPAGE